MSFKKVLQGCGQLSAYFDNNIERRRLYDCCSLFSICFTIVKQPGRWDNNDLEFILERGENLYKNENWNFNLSLEDLPKIISIFDGKVKVIYLKNEVGYLSNTSLKDDSSRIIINQRNVCVDLL